MPAIEDLPDYEADNEQNGSPTTPGLTHGSSLSDDSGDVEEGYQGTGSDNPLIIIVSEDRNPEDVVPVSSTISAEVDAFLDELGMELKLSASHS